MMGKVIISMDSTCDLGKELQEKYNVPCVPLIVMLGEKEYRDSVDISQSDIFDYVEKTGKLPKTAARNEDVYKDFFSSHTKNGDSVVHFCISSELSASYQNANAAAKEFENIAVIDTRVLSSGMALFVLLACDLRDDGKSFEEIVKAVKSKINKVQTSFVINTLDYLHKGGRCSSLALLAGKLLSIKPYIKMKDGKLGVCKKYRGNYKTALAKYFEQLNIEYPNPEKKYAFVTHTNCTEDIIEYIKSLAKQYFGFEEIFITTAGCTISSHCGPSTLGLLFINDTEIK